MPDFNMYVYEWVERSKDTFESLDEKGRER